MPILDAHVYCLPPRLADPRVPLPETERAIRSALHDHPEGPLALGLASPRAIARSLEESGIDGALLVSLPWCDGALCRENNAFVLEAAARDGRFRAVCSVQPRDGRWLEEAENCLAAGAVGLKVNPVWQGGALDGPEMDALADHVARRDRFLMVHVDHPWRKSVASPAHLLDLVRRHPRTRFLAAHLGGLLGLYACHPPVAQAIGNLWFDTAVSSTLALVRYCVEAGLQERVVFGSDFPFNHSHSQRQVLEGLRALPLPAPALGEILGKNLQSLLGRDGGAA